MPISFYLQSYHLLACTLTTNTWKKNESSIPKSKTQFIKEQNQDSPFQLIKNKKVNLFFLMINTIYFPTKTIMGLQKNLENKLKSTDHAAIYRGIREFLRYGSQTEKWGKEKKCTWRTKISKWNREFVA